MSYGKNLLAVALFLLTTSAAAAISTKHSETAQNRSAAGSAIEQFIKYGGMQEQFDQLPSLARTQLESNNSNRFSSSRYSELSGLILDAYEEDNVKKAMSRHLGLSYSAGRYRSLMKRLNNPTIKNLLEQEIDAFESPMSKYDFQQFLIKQKKAPESASRIALVKKLIEVSGDTDLKLHAQSAITSLIKELMIGPQDYSSIHAMLTEKSRFNKDKTPLQRHLFIYRNSNDDEINQLISFYQSNWGNWFKQTKSDAWLAALRDIGRDVAWKLEHGEDGDLKTAFEELDF